ncbi:MAG: hypothetical protein V1729_03270 [Candidatus Woesearchaeota archaeon]
MNKPTRVILLDEAQAEYARLNEIVGQQLKEGKDNTEEMQLLRSINQKKEFIKSNPIKNHQSPLRSDWWYEDLVAKQR